MAVADGAVYGDTQSSVFALNAANGKPVWVDRHLLGKGQGLFEIQPQVADGRVYLASAKGPGNGVLVALNAANGHLLWEFNTVLHPSPSVAAIGSGGAWETPLVGSDGSVTFGTGNPYETIAEAVEHPSRQLYTDSAVNLDATTGKLRWYYQAVPNDFMDHDLQASPVSTHTNRPLSSCGTGHRARIQQREASNSKESQGAGAAGEWTFVDSSQAPPGPKVPW